MSESYSWRAYYDDGSFLSQFNLDGTENLFPTIQQDKLVNFVISKEHTPELKNTDFIVSVRSGVFVLKGVKITFGSYPSNKLIYFRRVSVCFGQNLNIQPKDKYQCIGLKAKVNNRVRQVIFGVQEKTDAIIFVDKRDV